MSDTLRKYLILLSGGVGSRMKMDIPKQYIEINGYPIIYYTLNCFDYSVFEKITVVVADEWKNFVSRIIEKHFVSEKFLYAEAGMSRQESILNGLKTLVSSIPDNIFDDDVVVIHDAARPCLSKSLVSEIIEKCKNSDGVMPVLSIKDTVYRSLDGNTVTGLLKRDELFCGQSPEVFKLKKYFEVNKSRSENELAEIRGSSEIAFASGMKINLVNGDERNFKITTPSDLQRFAELVEGDTL